MKIITVYTQPGCQPCRAVKRWLDKRDVEYQTVDISTSPADLEAVKALGYQAAPVTIIGNTTGPAELRFTGSGAAVASFTVASTPRTFDRNSNEWKDGTTLFLRVSAWRELAENVAETLDQKGMRVVVTGRLTQREFEKDGQKRTVIELEADEVAPSLKYANAKVNRTQRSGGGNQGGQQQWAKQPAQADPWAAPAPSNAGQWGNGPSSEPAF